MLQAEQLVNIQGSAIVMGPTYRVISCDCAKNKELKTFEEWCEFCRCENCGGKNIVRPRQNDAFGRDNNAFSINLDLLLWLVVTSVAGNVIFFSSDQLYINLHATGIVAAACYVRQCFSRDSISLRM